MSGAAEKLLKGNNLRIAAGILRACAHPLRQQMLLYIHQNNPANVNSIYPALELEQSVASQQLKILRDANVVLTRREGKFIYYSLNYSLLQRVATSVETLFKD